MFLAYFVVIRFSTLCGASVEAAALGIEDIAIRGGEVGGYLSAELRLYLAKEFLHFNHVMSQ